MLLRLEASSLALLRTMIMVIGKGIFLTRSDISGGTKFYR